MPVSSLNQLKLSPQNLKTTTSLLKTKGFRKSFGRNNVGQITSAHKGGGHKRKYRKINFFRKESSVGIVCSIEYDPNRNCNIAVIYNIFSKKYFYIIAQKNLKIGNIIKAGKDAEPKLGHSLPISKVPVGTYIHNVSAKMNQKAQLSRAAGTFSVLLKKMSKEARIRTSSGEQRLLSENCLATIGVVSNELFFLVNKQKAGKSRWLGIRPTVRGVAKNPHDHPHGGGEGKKSKRRAAVTPWGKGVNRGKTSRSKNKLVLKKAS